MKKLVRHWAVDTYSLYLASLFASGIVFGDGWRTLLIAGAGLMAITLFGKPVINILLLPINMVTFGLFRWVSSAIALYLVELVIPGFEITRFKYAGLVHPWLDIPAMDLTGVWAYVAFAFVLSVISSIFYWIIK
jgi:putative membrane protein